MAATLLASDVSRVYHGDLDDLPQIESNAIRIFISSTFTDYAEERNLINRETIPKLRIMCQEHGLDLQIADMRWGVRDDVQVEHKTTELCLREIEKCKKLSRATYFVAFLGDKYGYRPYPGTIPKEEFELLVCAARTECGDAALMEKWYKMDENVIPPVYRLQPITDHFPYYNDESEEHEEKRNEDREQWNAVNQLLSTTFRQAAFIALKYGKMSAEQKHVYFRSVTEAEVAGGILDSQEHRDRTFCFRRDFQDIRHSDKIAGRFEDLDGGIPDAEASDLLGDLKTKRIPRIMSPDDIADDCVQWVEKGIDPKNNEHSEYLERFSQTFYRKVVQQIMKSSEHIDVPLLDKSQFYEVLRHAHFCNKKVAVFCGREEILKAIKAKLMQEHGQEELVKHEVELPDEDAVPYSGLEKEIQTMPRQKPAQKEEKTTSEADNEEVKDENLDTQSMKSSKEADRDQEENPSLVENEDFEVIQENAEVVSVNGKEEKEKKEEKVKKKEEEKEEEKEGKTENESEEADKLTELNEKQHTQNAFQSMGINFATELEELPDSDRLHGAMMVPELSKFHKPVILTGESGSGKTALMAKITTLIPKWFGTNNVVRIVRFLGTSPKTGNIKDTFLSICQQIIDAYDMNESIPHQCLQDFSTLSLYFCGLLSRIDTKSMPLVLVLDSVDQLSEEYYVFSMSWMPIALPLGVHFIISMLPKLHSCLENAQRHHKDSSSFVDIPNLPRETASDILKTWMKSSSRKLTLEQTEFILNHFLTCSQPIYLKVAFEQAKSWYSYTKSEDWILGLTIRSAIEQMYSRLEKQHGQILVGKALGYLTTAKAGLTDGEMDDILSLDDEVLQDTYLYHLPPNPDLVRLPPMLWSRISYDLQEYLVEREADGKTVISWYHRQFRETAIKRYLHTDMKASYHHALSDYFDGIWANVPKPLVLYKKKKGSFPNAVRGVSSQHLQYGKAKYNLRKLSEYPFHLLKAHRFDEFVKNCCSFEWLLAKAKAMTIFSVLHDITAAISVMEASIQAGGKANQIVFVTENEQDQELSEDDMSVFEGSEKDCQAAEEQEPDTREIKKKTSDILESDTGNLTELVSEVQMVFDLLQLSSDVLSKDANNLATQILGQLGPEECFSKVIDRLRCDAEQWSRSAKTPVIYPVTHCLPTAGKWLRASCDFKVSFSGDNPRQERKFSLSMDGKTLYGAEKTHKGGDILKLLNVNDYTLLYQKRMRDMSIRSVQMVCNDRYLLYETYTVRSKHSPQIREVLYDLQSNQPVILPPDTSILAYSKKEALLIIVGGGFNQDFLPGTEPDAPVLKTIAQMYNIETRKQITLKATVKSNVKVTQAVLSDDEDTLLLLGESKFLSGYVFAKDLDGKYRHIKTNILQSPEDEFGFGKKKKIPLKIVQNNRLVFAGTFYQNNKKLFISDMQSGEIMREFQLSEHYAINMIEASKDLSTLLVCTTDTVMINGDDRKPITVVDTVQCRIKCVCEEKGPYTRVLFCGARNDLLIAARCFNAGIAVWYVGSDSLDGICLFNIYGHSESPTYLQMTPDEKTLITASSDNTIKFWKLENIIQSCEDALESVSELMTAAFDGDKDSMDKIKATLAVDDSKPLRVREGQQLALCTAVSRDGKVAAVGTRDCWVIFYDLSTIEMMSYHKESRKVVAMLTTRSGSYIVSAARDIKLWDPNTGAHVRTLEHGGKTGGKYSGFGGGEVSCLDEASDILVAGYSGMECYGVLWDLKTGTLIKQLEGLYGFSTVGITSDAKTVVSTFFEFPIIFDVSSGQPLNLSQPDIMMSGSSCLRISPDDQLVVTCSTDGSVRVCDIHTGRYLHHMRHSSSVVEATFTPDSSLLLTAGFKNVLVWSMKTGQLLYTLTRHQDFITCMKFCRNGQFLVTASKDKEIVIWDFKEKISISSFIAHCPLMAITVADDLSSILYSPEHVAYLGVLKPNRKLKKIIKGNGVEKVEENMQKAQAFALAFSSQKVADKSSRACTIL